MFAVFFVRALLSPTPCSPRHTAVNSSLQETIYRVDVQLVTLHRRAATLSASIADHAAQSSATALVARRDELHAALAAAGRAEAELGRQVHAAKADYVRVDALLGVESSAVDAMAAKRWSFETAQQAQHRAQSAEEALLAARLERDRARVALAAATLRAETVAQRTADEENGAHSAAMRAEHQAAQLGARAAELQREEVVAAGALQAAHVELRKCRAAAAAAAARLHTLQSKFSATEDGAKEGGAAAQVEEVLRQAAAAGAAAEAAEAERAALEAALQYTKAASVAVQDLIKRGRDIDECVALRGALESARAAAAEAAAAEAAALHDLAAADEAVRAKQDERSMLLDILNTLHKRRSTAERQAAAQGERLARAQQRCRR